MKTIYILLTKSGTLLSRIVGIVTADAYTHVSIAFDACLYPLYSSSRKNGETLFPAGPCVERLRMGYYSKHPTIPCALYKLEVSDEIYERAKEETQRILSRADQYGFNILGLLTCQMRIPWHRRRHFFCSQFVGEILRRSEALELPKDTTLLRPSDYMGLPQLQCLFRGRLKELWQNYAVPMPV